MELVARTPSGAMPRPRPVCLYSLSNRSAVAQTFLCRAPLRFAVLPPCPASPSTPAGPGVPVRLRLTHERDQFDPQLVESVRLTQAW